MLHAIRCTWRRPRLRVCLRDYSSSKGSIADLIM
jgi:hypothetical protein